MSNRSPIWALLLLVAISSSAIADIVPDFLMGTDPEFAEPAMQKDFKKDFKGIWLQALERPEADYQRMTAMTVARAHVYGIPGLVDLVPALQKILVEPTSNLSARYAAAHALIVLDARSTGAALFESAQKYGADFRQLVEPAIAKWNVPTARETWLKRLETSETLPRDLILALRALGELRDSAALPAALKIVMDPLRPSMFRLEAASTAGEIADSGLDEVALKLIRGQVPPTLVDRLCAVRILARQSSEQTRRLLIELASDPDFAVAASALKRLTAVDSDLSIPIATSSMKSVDPYVRLEAANAFFKRPSLDRIASLALLLDDDHPSVRRRVADGLVQLAKNSELEGAVRSRNDEAIGNESMARSRTSHARTGFSETCRRSRPIR